MIYIWLNILPILAATMVGLGLSALPWRRGMQGAGLFGIAAAEFWLAAILAGAIILAPPGRADAWTMALGSAFIIWIGFVLPVLLVTSIGHRRGWPTGLRDGGWWLAVMLAQAAVMRAIGVAAPPG